MAELESPLSLLDNFAELLWRLEREIGPASEHFEITSVDVDIETEGHRCYKVQGYLHKSACVQHGMRPEVENMLRRHNATLLPHANTNAFWPRHDFEMKVYMSPTAHTHSSPLADAALPDIAAAVTTGELTEKQAVQALQALGRMEPSPSPSISMATGADLDRVVFDSCGLYRFTGETDAALRTRFIEVWGTLKLHAYKK